MDDHPILGAVLFAIGVVFVAAAHCSSNVQSLLLGHIIAFNGVLLVVLGCRRLERQFGDANRALGIAVHNKLPSR